MTAISSRRIFCETVWDYYREHARHDLPWRVPEADGSFDAYKIMVSELMLQQTQVPRVIPKYHQFLQQFPTVNTLAKAPLGDVLRVWSGLGYNRRAKFLHQAAQQITHDCNGQFPQNTDELMKLSGIGAGTAGAIRAYACNDPVVFIETNIRTIYIHHFFNDQAGIADKEILKLVEETLDREHPREWYWALMDYGSHLKQTIGNPNRQSKHYAKQSKFEGSRRQLRGVIIRSLSAGPKKRIELSNTITDERLESVINDLLEEGLLQREGSRLSL